MMKNRLGAMADIDKGAMDWVNVREFQEYVMSSLPLLSHLLFLSRLLQSYYFAAFVFT